MELDQGTFAARREGTDAAGPPDPCLRPTRLITWDDSGGSAVPLGKGHVPEWPQPGTDDRAIWIDCHLDGLKGDLKAWFSGWYGVSQSRRLPIVDWTPTEPLLALLGFHAPGADPARDTPAQRLLRSVPYVFCRGLQGTIRDLDGCRADAGNEGARS